jgi:hypothetical protein
MCVVRHPCVGVEAYERKHSLGAPDHTDDDCVKTAFLIGPEEEAALDHPEEYVIDGVGIVIASMVDTEERPLLAIDGLGLNSSILGRGLHRG